jgi:hypothetical protein
LEEEAGGCRRLHNEELHNLYATLSIIRVIKSNRTRWVGYAAHMGEMKNEYLILVEKPEGKRPTPHAQPPTWRTRSPYL